MKRVIKLSGERLVIRQRCLHRLTPEEVLIRRGI